MTTEDGRVLALAVLDVRAGASRDELPGTLDAVSSWMAEQPTRMVHGERVHAA